MFILWQGIVNIKFLNPIAMAIKDFSLSDSYYQISWTGGDKKKMSTDIVLVDITELDRGQTGEVLKQVHECRPSAVGVDAIYYGEKDFYGDSLLASAAQAMPEAVFAVKLLQSEDTLGVYTSVHKPFFSDRLAPENEGYVNTEEYRAKVTRNFSILRTVGSDTIKSLVARVVENYRGQPIPKDQSSDRAINFEYIGFPIVSCDSILENRQLFENRIVLLGCLTDKNDILFTPVGEMAGMEMLAFSLQTLIDQREIRNLSLGEEFLLILFITHLTVLWFYVWFAYIGRFNNSICAFLATSKLFLRVMTFIWLAFVAWGTYVVYERYDIIIRLAMLLSSVILVGEGRGIYMALIKGLNAKYPNGWWRNSLYYK